jgi:hypothetical protein
MSLPPGDPRRFMEDIHGRQRNTVWPDTVRNGRAVDAFLWRGSPNATRAQRIGACLFGLHFVGLGIVFVILARGAGSSVIVAVGFAVILLGLELCRKGCLRRKKEPPKNTTA